MNFKTNYFYTLLAPLMILISIIGFTVRDNKKKNFYLPLGIIGTYLIIERVCNRKIKRVNILNKIKYFQKSK